jgi:predicted Zn-dependent peptidase
VINYEICAAGYPVYHYYKPDASIVEAQVFVKAGSAHEDDDSWGVAHFLEHLCFQGTPTKNKHQISREMSLIGNYNAYTNYFCTCYHFDSLNESFEKGFSLLSESVFDSCYPEYEFEKEKRVIVEEWRMYDNYPSEAYKNFALDKYFGSADGHPIIGTQESIEGMNPEKLHRYRNKCRLCHSLTSHRIAIGLDLSGRSDYKQHLE